MKSENPNALLETTQDISLQFEVAGGGVRGRDHALSGQDCQDSHTIVSTAGAIIAVVADGCGSAHDSAIGAHLGCRLLARTLARRLHDNPDVDTEVLLEQSRVDVLHSIVDLVEKLGPPAQLREVLSDSFLFTILGFAITEQETFVFGIGDGMYVLNGVATEVGPFPGNAPPYLTYGFMKSSVADNPYRFQLHAKLPTADLKSVLIGTDGALGLLDLSEVRVPGRDELVGDLAQFWENDRYFRNPDAIRRRLAVINREVQVPLWNERRIQRANGLLRDDTTLIVARRRGAQ